MSFPTLGQPPAYSRYPDSATYPTPSAPLDSTQFDSISLDDEPPTYEEAVNGAKPKGSIWSDIGSAAAKVCAFPFRAASTAVNGSLFAGYYVATMAATGLAAAAGTAYGIADISRNYLCGEPLVKSLSEYAIAPAKTTFNGLSRLYDELPEQSTEIIFAGVAVAAVIVAAVVASKDSSSSDCRVSRRNNFIFFNSPTVHHHWGNSHQSSGDLKSRLTSS